MNGDGRADVLVTAPGNDAGGVNTGRVYIMSGADGSVLRTMNSQASNSQCGAAVGGLGDLNGDGIPDFGVGAPAASGTGRVYVLNGATADTLFFSIPGDSTDRALGLFWLNSPGDVNGDGVPDVFASDLGNTSRGANTGRAYVYSGANGSTLRTFSGESAGDQFGLGRGVPDVTGDGVGDLVLAAWLRTEGASQGGKVYVFSGSDGTLVRTVTSVTPGENLGFDVIGIGDISGDGVPDFLVSGGISSNTPGSVMLILGIVP